MNLTGNGSNPQQEKTQEVIIKPIEEFNVVEQKEKMELKVKNSPEVMSIVRQIDIKNMDSIMKFGNSTAENIAKFSDMLLHQMELAKVEDSGEMLMQLNKIMEKFDIKDFKDKEPGFLGKLFKKVNTSIEGIFKKYHSMGDEVDKVYVTLKSYEAEIATTNKNLDAMFDKNLEYYEELERYIYAGEMALEEFNNNIIPNLEKKAEESGDRVDQMEVSNMLQVREMFDQRIYDLKLAENIALQTMPSIKTIQYGNYNLVRKINSAFIITLPIFKQCLTQSIMLKRQDIQAKALSALDEKTNELLLRNAQNTALQSKVTAKLASGSFVSIETLEKSWQTIVTGIEETKQIQNEMKQKRVEGSQKLQELKKDFEDRKLI